MKLPASLQRAAADVAVELQKIIEGQQRMKLRDQFDGEVDRLLSIHFGGETRSSQVSKLKRALRSCRAQLITVVADCKMALSGEWDKSDEGFEATKDACETVLHSTKGLTR